MNILILMAGAANDFAEKGYSFPKYLIEIQNKPIIQRTIESLETVGKKITCIIKKEDQEKYYLGDTLKILCSNCNVIEVHGNTKGAVCTALFAIDEINNDEEFTFLLSVETLLIVISSIVWLQSSMVRICFDVSSIILFLVVLYFLCKYYDV